MTNSLYMPRITVVTLGPGDPDLLNQKTLRALESAPVLILRTDRHPLSSWLREKHIAFSSLDFLYESAEDFEDLLSKIAAHLWARAAEGPLVYAVPDALSDASLRRLLSEKPEGVSVEVIPGAGYADVSVSGLFSLLPVSDLRCVSAGDLILSSSVDPNIPLLVCELDQPALAGDVKVFLSDFYEDEHPVYVLTPSDPPRALPLFELDRQPRYDHVTSLFIPSSSFLERDRFVLPDLLRIMEALRAPSGCPWDSKQTHQSLRPYLSEEAWEAIGAIDEEDPDHLSEELGDLLFQIVFHSSIARACGEFTVQDVISAISRKMIRRHPHVFRGETWDAAESASRWEEIKREESDRKSPLDSLQDISPALPALQYAEKAFKKLRQLPSAPRSEQDILRDLAAALEALEAACPHSADSFRLAGARSDAFGDLLLRAAELSQLDRLDAEILLHEKVRNLLIARKNAGLSDNREKIPRNP